MEPSPRDIQYVQCVCPHISADDIRADLRFTNNVQLTINRCLDGNFVRNSRPIIKSPSKKEAEALFKVINESQWEELDCDKVDDEQLKSFIEECSPSPRKGNMFVNGYPVTPTRKIITYSKVHNSNKTSTVTARDLKYSTVDHLDNLVGSFLDDVEKNVKKEPNTEQTSMHILPLSSGIKHSGFNSGEVIELSDSSDDEGIPSGAAGSSTASSASLKRKNDDTISQSPVKISKYELPSFNSPVRRKSFLSSSPQSVKSLLSPAGFASHNIRPKIIRVGPKPNPHFTKVVLPTPATLATVVNKSNVNKKILPLTSQPKDVNRKPGDNESHLKGEAARTPSNDPVDEMTSEKQIDQDKRNHCDKEMNENSESNQQKELDEKNSSTSSQNDVTRKQSTLSSNSTINERLIPPDANNGHMKLGSPNSNTAMKKSMTTVNEKAVFNKNWHKVKLPVAGAVNDYSVSEANHRDYKDLGFMHNNSDLNGSVNSRTSTPIQNKNGVHNFTAIRKKANVMKNWNDQMMSGDLTAGRRDTWNNNVNCSNDSWVNHEYNQNIDNNQYQNDMVSNNAEYQETDDTEYPESEYQKPYDSWVHKPDTWNEEEEFDEDDEYEEDGETDEMWENSEGTDWNKPQVPSGQDNWTADEWNKYSAITADSQITSSQNSSVSSRGKSRSKKTPEQIALENQEKMRKQEEREQKKAAKEQEKLEKLKQRELKKQEKEQQKLEKAKEKAAKKAVQDANKNSKPGECTKFVVVMIDGRLINGSSLAPALLGTLQGASINYRVQDLTVPNSITWKRQVPSTDMNQYGQVDSKMEEKDENEALVYIPINEFVDLVANSEHPSANLSLSSFVKQVKQNLMGKNLTIIVKDIERYFRSLKTLQQREYRQAVLNVENAETQNNKNNKFKVGNMDITTQITRVQLEEALVDVQVTTGCNIKLVETEEAVAKTILQYTKSVAEITFKQSRLNNVFSFMPDLSGSVRVDKEGKGLIKVWKQHIQQFRNVSAEMAAAIIAQYPSPQILIQAYKRCSPKEGELLLQDISVRRGAGVLETNRRIGKELSRRIYQHMMFDDPNFLLE